MPEADGFAATALCVVCESYEDVGRFPRLVGARAQMAGIAGRLRTLGFAVRVVGETEEPDLAVFEREAEEWSTWWRQAGNHGPALILWSGHGVLDGEDLRLALHDLELTGQDPHVRKRRLRKLGVTAADLVELALASGADQTLVFVDACHAGAGLSGSVRTALDHLKDTSLPDDRSKWVGVMASCRAGELSEGYGPLLASVAGVLAEGPRSDEYHSAWSVRNESVTGGELLAAVWTRWDEESQQPEQVTVGHEERPRFPNPRSEPGARAALVEHLVLAARGVGHREEGWFFTGRRRVLEEIIAWMGAAAPGLFLVTGPAGCGKSAVLGRIATLVDPGQRAETERQGALREGDPDPGVRDPRTFAAVHLRGLNALQAAVELAGQLRLDEPKSVDAFRAELRELPSPPVVVLDGLDEVPAEHTQGVIEELVFPLSRMVPVLVGSRERPFRNQLADGETLPQALNRYVGAGAVTVDLEEEPDTREDIAGYVRRRCEAADVDGTQIAEIAEALAARATEADGGFLFARLVTGSLISRLREGAVSGAELLAGLPESVEAAFEEDLRSGPVRVRDDGTELPSAARDLLTALAWAAGRGMPAGGVWEAVASALRGPDAGMAYDEGDVDWVLSAYGRYVVEDGGGSQAVYRLYHREFVSYLRGREGPGGEAAGMVVLEVVAGLLRRQAEAGDWEGVDPYVRRSLAHHAGWAGEPGIRLLRGLVEWDRGNALPHLGTALYESTLALRANGNREAALASAREAAAIYAELNDSDPVRYLPDVATCLGALAIVLAETGERQGALEPAQEAVRINRELARTNPTAHLPNLATFLSNLASHLAQAGDRQSALEPAQEAVHISRELARANPTAHLPNLAQSLTNLAGHLTDSGDRQGALEPAQEAVHINRELTRTNPAAHLPQLASSLNNLAIALANSGDRQGGLEAAHEAVRIRRDLTRTNPAAHLPYLAGSLNTLAGQLAEAGDPQGALEPAQEAVRIYTRLTRTSPAAHLPQLASSLTTLANRLAGIGRPQDALEPAHEAVRIRRELTRTNPAAHLPELAGSLNNLAIRLAETGDRQGGLEAAHEAVRIRRDLARTNPAAHLPHLAGSLNTLANRLADMGRYDDALQAAYETVRIRRDLTRADLAAHLPELAGSLTTLTIRLADAGYRQAALEPAREAVRIRRDLARTNPAAHLPHLAGSLNNLANLLAEAGDRQGADEPAQEAVRIYTRLTRTSPAAHLPHLASSLNTLANCLAVAGRPQDALEPARKAVRIRRDLARTNPAAHLPHLAGYLNNLANRLAETGDLLGALKPGREAVRIRGDLTRTNPAAHLPHLVTCVNNLARHLVATGSEAAAVQVFSDAADSIAPTDPAAARAITYERAAFRLAVPSPESGRAGLRELVVLLHDGPPDAPDDIALRARRRLRSFVRAASGNRQLVDQMYQETLGTPVPDWLSLSDEVLELAAAWMATGTWEESQAFWSQHADRLGAEDTATALSEYALVTPVAEDHLALRRQILSEGADPVFRELILHDQLTTWLECEDWETSRCFLAEHPRLIADEAAEDVLAADDPRAPEITAHIGLLHMARTEDIDTAYQRVQDRDALQRYVQRALTEGDARALAYASAIEHTAFDDQPASLTHHQAALVLAGKPDDLTPDDLSAAAARADPDTRTRLVSELAALSTRPGQDPAPWLRLIQALTQPRT
ncbi:tetratricopeptide repeat protein [Streptomyces sp. S.PNR 29]|uniref:tetratricopeptide repeat protein n=1 Tax=Streptomyces sp. S.PNR 29 TaxID=2973805 RepID=UPI0025B1313C|nr:tetratricopeptide repeat protein [Streptomyces sp. S.PNR 29]